MGRLFTEHTEKSFGSDFMAKNAGETHFLSSARMALLAILLAGIGSFFLPTS
jgi:hypothetical protein